MHHVPCKKVWSRTNMHRESALFSRFKQRNSSKKLAAVTVSKFRESSSVALSSFAASYASALSTTYNVVCIPTARTLHIFPLIYHASQSFYHSSFLANLFQNGTLPIPPRRGRRRQPQKPLRRPQRSPLRGLDSRYRNPNGHFGNNLFRLDGSRSVQSLLEGDETDFVGTDRRPC